MRNIVLFVEDFGHDEVIRSIIKKVNLVYNIQLNLIPRNVTGGHGRVLKEFEIFLREISKNQQHIPDMVIIGSDTNCKGFVRYKKEIKSIIEKYPLINDITVLATPHPHVERWLLLDGSAFKDIIGHGCNAPDKKCGKDRYKQLLIGAIRKAGKTVRQSGFEYAHDIIMRMDYNRITIDKSISTFIDGIKRKFAEWNRAER